MTLAAFADLGSALVWSSVAVSAAVTARALHGAWLARRHHLMVLETERQARAELHATCERIVDDARARALGLPHNPMRDRCRREGTGDRPSR